MSLYTRILVLCNPGASLVNLWCTLIVSVSSSLPSQLGKELEDARGDKDRSSSEAESLQLCLDLLKSKYEGEAKKQEEQIQKLQQLLRERPLRRKVVPPSVPEGSPALPPVPSTAPTAAVKPTVTTTPTASIRPIAIQTTSAPTAHVTPTMVTQHVAPSTTQLSSSSATAAVFVRPTSPQVSTPVPVVVASASISVAATTTTSVSPMPAISQSVERGAERGGERGGERAGERGAKRQRDDEQQEPGRYGHCVLT